MKKGIKLALIAVLTLCLAVIVVACNKDNDKQNELTITAVDPAPIIVPYKDFDVSTAFVKEDGVAYEYSGFYINARGQEKAIEFDGNIINIPQDDVVAEINVIAHKGTKTVEKLFQLDVKGTPDVIDNGYAGSWNDSSIGKTINYDPEYIKNGDSSIKVSFSGYYVEYGTQYATLPGHLSTKENGIYDRDYFSIYKEQNVEEAWKDAVLYFWIYYAATPRGNDDMALDIGFFYGRHKENGEERIAYEFGDTPITECAYGEWTQVAIRMKDLGQTSDLYLNVQDYYSSYAYDPEKNCDMITFKCRGRDTDYLGKDVKYTYTFYMDDIDITTYKDFKEKYPEYNWGVDYGNTLDRKFSVENWKTSGKGISFEYELKNKDNPTSNIFNVFAHVDDGAGKDTWARLIENITLDFATNTATVGQIIDIGNGKYRYELMFDDCTPNLAPGEEPTGEETASSIYFVEYNNAMLISEFAVITEYSDK